MPFFNAKDGTALFYNDWGTGRPVVLIHGWPLNADMWEYQATQLAAEGFRVISYDRRGFGRSAQPWNGFDYDTLADDLASLITALDLRDATLVGFSMGGGEVARYLSRHGCDRVAAVALIGAVTPYLLKAEDHPQGLDRSVFDGMIEGLNKDRPAFLAAFGKMFYGVDLPGIDVSAEILAWSHTMALQAAKNATLACVRAFSETDFRPDLSAFTVPTLIVHGDADAIVPIDLTARAVAKAIPHARFEVYPGAPHGLIITHKDRLRQDLLTLLLGEKP